VCSSCSLHSTTKYLHKRGRNEFLAHEDILSLGSVRDSFLGSANDMTSNAPVPDPNTGKLIGGTAFERCGQRAVKESGRCYSLSMTHQRQRALVGPTSSGKFYEDLEETDEYMFNLEIRGKVTEVRKTHHDI
jgi:hypothetical protein